MAYFKIEQNTKGLVAKVQVYAKDKSGKRKIVSKRIYNDKNLTLPKFQKEVEKFSLQFEEDVQNGFKTFGENRNKILTFSQLSKEFIENIKNNLSINYYDKAKDTVSKFEKFLEENGLSNEPINLITVRDVQMFLNSFKSYKYNGSGNIKLKKDLPKSVNWRLLAREKIIDRDASYRFKKNEKKITKEKALKICKFCNLEFNQYFEEVNKTIPYATETIKGHRRVLRTIFNEAVRYDWISKNPVSQTKVGAGNNNVSLRSVAEKEVFSIQEAKDFLLALDNLDDDLIYKKTVIKFMLLTGVRIAEMCGLRWSDIDFTKKVVKLLVQGYIIQSLELMKKNLKQKHLLEKFH